MQRSDCMTELAASNDGDYTSKGDYCLYKVMEITHQRETTFLDKGIEIIRQRETTVCIRR